ncbi:MAG: hypothetical protein HFI49_04630 [Bacilli bacterium]|nr:hypothetical protein [Bacilli bacterium]
MSFIGDFINHEKVVQRRFEQLEALNDVIAERQAEASQAEIYYQSLDRDVKAKKRELEDLLVKLQLVDDIRQMEKKKADLQQKLGELGKRLEGTYSPSEVIFAIYETMNGNNALMNAFSYIGESKPEDDGVLYQSLSGDKLIGFTKDFDSTLYYDEGDPYYINAKAETFISFSEACIDLGNTLYLKKRVTAEEVNSVFMEFRKKYVIHCDDYGYCFARVKKRRNR